MIALCITVATPSTTPAQDNLRNRLIGIWLDYRSDNLVYFGKDGAWKLYLKKGEMGRSISGSWVLAPNLRASEVAILKFLQAKLAKKTA
jgi:hypothetical protein